MRPDRAVLASGQHWGLVLSALVLAFAAALAKEIGITVVRPLPHFLPEMQGQASRVAASGTPDTYATRPLHHVLLTCPHLRDSCLQSLGAGTCRAGQLGGNGVHSKAARLGFTRFPRNKRRNCWGAAGQHGACRRLLRGHWAVGGGRGSSPKAQPDRVDLQPRPDQASGAPLSAGPRLAGVRPVAQLHCWRPAGSNLP